MWEGAQNKSCVWHKNNLQQKQAGDNPQEGQVTGIIPGDKTLSLPKPEVMPAETVIFPFPTKELSDCFFVL